MTLSGLISWSGGLPRSYMPGFVKDSSGVWQGFQFRIDTGSDITCLPANSSEILGLQTSRLPIADDLLGVGSPSLAYHEYETVLALGEVQGRPFKGSIAIFRNPEDLDEPVLGMDVLQAFTLVLDVRGNRIFLTDQPIETPAQSLSH